MSEGRIQAALTEEELQAFIAMADKFAEVWESIEDIVLRDKLVEYRAKKALGELDIYETVEFITGSAQTIERMQDLVAGIIAENASLLKTTLVKAGKVVGGNGLG